MTTTPIEKPRITITNVIWSLDPETLAVKLLLIKRADSPFQNFWALPETWLRVDESAHEATLRLVKEKIGLDLPNVHAEQLATFTEPNRSPGERALSLSYMTFLPSYPTLQPGPGALDAQWFTLKKHPSGLFSFKYQDLAFQTLVADDYITHQDSTKRLAFDHNWMLTVATQRIINKLDYQPTILLILGSDFTLKMARHVFESFGKKEPDNSNFLRNHQHLLRPLGSSSQNRPGRPAKKYQLLIQ